MTPEKRKEIRDRKIVSTPVYVAYPVFDAIQLETEKAAKLELIEEIEKICQEGRALCESDLGAERVKKDILKKLTELKKELQ